MAKHGTGGNVSVRFYMEGRLVENALRSVQVAGHTGQPATAQLEVVPTDTIRHILPFTWVHVFTTDPWDAEPAGDLSDYKLLFEGVVVARGFSRQDDGRSFVLQCADPSIFWVEARQFWFNTAGGNIIDQVIVQSTSGRARFGTVTKTGAFGILTSNLRKSIEDDEEHFLDTMIASIDDIGNVNPFYTNARNRFRITDRILRGPAGNTEKLFRASVLTDFFDGLSGRVSGQSNLAEVVNQLLDPIMHEWVSIVAPPYVSARIFERDVFGNIKRTSQEVVRKFRDGSRKTTLYNYKMATDKVVGNYVFKPHVYTISPPTCNVLFPNMYDQMSFSESFLGETTRLHMRPQLPMVSAAATQFLFLLRPTELETFNRMTRDSKRQTWKRRTPDGKYADGEGQAPVFHDYDWMTNEERFRGIVYNFMNLAPAPSTLTIGNQGERKPRGARSGGLPKYLMNVASYEYYKSKFVARQSGIAGPYNMRPVPGFPIVILDDSDANLNIIAYLDSVVHTIDADGVASTQYAIRYPRLYDEVDLNRPRFKGTGVEAELDLNLIQDANGNYQFDQLFDGKNRPPIPEWFDESYTELYLLDDRYREWFGENVGVVENRRFVNAAGTDDEKAAAIAQNNAVDLNDVIDDLNASYKEARQWGREFIEASNFTDRAFTRIDEAFRFVGAGPAERADSLQTESTGAVFKSSPAATREINYKTDRLDTFVGDVSRGSGYAGVPLGERKAQPSSGAESDAVDRMSGAFPVFDTAIHTGDEATDEDTRKALLADDEQRKKSSWPRYEGRPVMYDFEYRLWQESIAAAGIEPVDADIETAVLMANRKSTGGGTTARKTGAERAEAAQERAAQLAAEAKEQEELTSAGYPAVADRRNFTPAQAAPTGDSTESGEKQPLPQPLAERQVVDIRRAVVDAYREELAKSRGFTG